MFTVTSFFKKLKEIVYLEDQSSQELLYLNDFGRQVLDIPLDEPIEGLKIGEVLKGFEDVRSMCDIYNLEDQEFHNHIFHNKELDKYFDMKIILTEYRGRNVFFVMAIDIDEKQRQGYILQNIAYGEKMINEALNLALNEDDPEEGINIMLEYIGTRLSCDRMYIFEEKKDGFFANTYEWCKEGISSEKDNLQNVPFDEVIEVWYKEFDHDNNILIRNIESYKEISLPMYNVLKPQNIETLVVGPIVRNNRRIGFFGADNPPIDIMNSISAMYEALGHFISAMLRQRENLFKLEKASLTDSLTGLCNRHALDIFMNQLDRENSIGLIFCDINGLKRINDTLGHVEGDELIINAASVMEKEYGRDNVFRMGGDEFLIVIAEIEEKDLAEAVTVLRKKFKERGISVAIGSIWKSHSKFNFDRLFQEVDTEMYADKSIYYSNHERRRDRIKSSDIHS